ncbi:hypothetical protein [Cryobacterium sp. Y57]|uniref:HAAS signaling domain-containing protein n=1 Tax=Cryobacterium sp. Y57 TaxID=2048287 RepID=UPI000CE5280B|nr:hypothetical protein [Cryobacterium sp. Y57]
MNAQTTEARSTFAVWRRRESYLFRFDLALEESVTTRERRSILREIRDNIEVDAAARGIDAALESLGSPRALARSFAEDGRGNRPSWVRAIYWFTGLLLLWWTLAFTFTAGLLSALMDSGAESTESYFLGLLVSAFNRDSGIGIGWEASSFSAYIPLIIMVIAAVIAGRLWRVLTRRR